MPASHSNKEGVHNQSSEGARRQLQLPSPPPDDFQVSRRAVLLSSDEEDEDSDESPSKPSSSAAASRENRGRAILLSEEEEEPQGEETEWLGKKSAASAGPSNTERKREKKKPEAHGMLKSLKLKAKKLREKQKKRRKKDRMRSDEEEGEAMDSDGSNDGDGDMRADSYDSEDSDANEHISARQLKLMRELEQKCVDFLNESDVTELNACEKFNDKFVAFVLANRPFENFRDLKSKLTVAPGRKAGAGAFVRLLDNYLEWLENRGILDKVLDDCRKHSKVIEKALDDSEGSAPVERPAGLNPSCSLHPYQQIGLNWLILMSRLGMNAILADEMGLGKTIQVIAFLAWAKSQQEVEPRLRGPHLIVVPSSTIENWMQEIAHWAPSLRVLTYYGSIDERMQLRHSAWRHSVDVILSTYNMVISRPEDRKFFKKFSLNYVIYDEGHMLRNCATQRYTNLMKVRGKRKILVTGTPLQNNLVELISLMYFTMRQLFDRYCDDITSLLQMFAMRGKVLMEKSQNKGRNAKKPLKNESKNEDGGEEEMPEEVDKDNGLYEKHKIGQAKSILQPFILRRLKTEVLVSLPAKHEHIEFCELSPIQVELYEELMDILRARRSSTSGNEEGGAMMGFMMQMRQVANHPLLYRRFYDDDKVEEMARILCQREKFYENKRSDYVAEALAFETDIALHTLCQKFSDSIGHFSLDERLALDSGKFWKLDTLLPEILRKKEKVLIFSQFTSLLDILELYMHCHSYAFLRLDGSTPVLERQELINKFNNESTDFSIFLLSTKAGGLGINLTAANHIIIHDIDFNPYNDKQAEDRCHRMGQTKEVHVFRLISKNTIEEQILTLAHQKLALERDVTSSSGGEQQKANGLSKQMVDELLTQTLKRH
ncbi:hypothetical protein niasHT_004733 [Heterodera trifolii]|uniref:Uncharacterized protein n=1 Tax=Heterodera trifolii TaxID=157864 RepID=A0ABD2M9J3_9BILA